MSATPASLSAFLNGCERGEPVSADPGASEELQRWVQAHPEAALRLVRRAQAAQAELEAARRELTRQERARRMGVKAGVSAEELKRQSQAWDRLLGTRDGHRVQAAGGGGTGGSAPAAARRLTFEDLGARFVHAHVGKLWLGLGVVAAIVIALR